MQLYNLESVQVVACHYISLSAPYESEEYIKLHRQVESAHQLETHNINRHQLEELSYSIPARE